MTEEQPVQIQLATLRADVTYMKQRLDESIDAGKADRLEFKGAVKALNDTFLELERGRLTRIESKVAEMEFTHKAQTSSTSRWVSFWTSLATAVAIAFIFLVLRLFIPSL